MGYGLEQFFGRVPAHSQTGSRCRGSEADLRAWSGKCWKDESFVQTYLTDGRARAQGVVRRSRTRLLHPWVMFIRVRRTATRTITGRPGRSTAKPAARR